MDKPTLDTSKPIEETGPVHCPNEDCHALVGYYVVVDGQVWLQSGVLQLYSLHGRCCVCHTEYHYHASDKDFEKLIRRCLNHE